MLLPANIQNLLAHYSYDSPAVRLNLARIFMHGTLAGSGKLMILPIDQGFEHGPDRCFAGNVDAYDPLFHFSLALEAGFSAYAAPLGMLEAAATSPAGYLPTILKMNSSNSLLDSALPPRQAITGSIHDALRLGCIGIGLTIYPGSDDSLAMFEDVQRVIEEARRVGLISVVWSYPRGNLNKEAETALDVIAYGAHIACLLGAHIVKVKLPTEHLAIDAARSEIISHHLPTTTLADRVQHVMRSCFNGRRIVVFSGGEAKNDDALIEESTAIIKGGGHGSIIGRNCFKRPRADALQIISQLMKLYRE